MASRTSPRRRHAPPTGSPTSPACGWWTASARLAAEGTGPVPRTVFFDVAHGLNGQRPPYLPWAAKLRDDRREQEAKDNPDARCLPLGPLQMLAHPLPKKIIQMPGLLVLLHERNMEFRQIFLDGRPLPADQQPSWYGYSTGRWEGDTLVVETSGFRDGLWADFYGSPLTDQAKLTERFRRPELRHALGAGDYRRPQGVLEAVDGGRQPALRSRRGAARVRVFGERKRRASARGEVGSGLSSAVCGRPEACGL